MFQQRQKNWFSRNTKTLNAVLLGLILSMPVALIEADEISQLPLGTRVKGLNVEAPPLTMLIMGKDHTLYYEAYNDTSDINGDNILDVGYKPNLEDRDGNAIDYYGYFDSYLCYAYNENQGLFEPIEKTNDKKCKNSSAPWSGDFLNYVTTSRIDALRKVLYGGKRIIDTANTADDPDAAETVLERAYIPQDAHSWGKEYTSAQKDGYNIEDYTPLSLPKEPLRHLFASTTLSSNADKRPLMRVLNDSPHRIWEWVAIERPVADSECNEATSRVACKKSDEQKQTSHPNNADEFAQIISKWKIASQRCGSGAISNGRIDTTGRNNNPWTPNPDPLNCGTDEYFLTIIKGQIYIPSDGDYQFATNGDDAVEFYLDNEKITGWYTGHGARTDGDIKTRAENTGSIVTVPLRAGWKNFEFHHEELTGNDSYQLLWNPSGDIPWQVVPSSNFRLSAEAPTQAPNIETYKMVRNLNSSITDYTVKVKVCMPNLLETNCKLYIDQATNVTTYKPDGLLQKYGKDQTMRFGLITGAFTHPYNMRGGVLRKNIEDFISKTTTSEVDPETGVFNRSFSGIVDTIDKFRITDFGGNSNNYAYGGGWLTTKAMPESGSKFPDWGNPISEMLYESLRYFSGKTAPSSAFLPSLKDNTEVVSLREYSGDQSTVAFPAPAWIDPYEREDQNAPYCSPGAQLIISDVNPSYDSDQVPGVFFSDGTVSDEISGLNVKNEADELWTDEYGEPNNYFIGQVGTLYDGAPTAKEVITFNNIRGLSPSEPTKQGSYYSAALTKFAYENDLRTDQTENQDINTFAVALASPLPKISIPAGSGTNRVNISLVPFAKSVGGDGYNIDPDKKAFQSTNTIVDFFIEDFANTDPNGSDKNLALNEGRPYIKFRINYEDVEQGADHDMDAIVNYEFKVNENGTLTINLNSEYAAGGIIQHMGYVISGTSKDGVYLEVRDRDTKEDSDPAYFLNTPPDHDSGYCDKNPAPDDCKPLPLTASRTFSPGTGVKSATVLESPLWYIPKYSSKDGRKGISKGQTSPNYFLVTNAGKLANQLEQAFEQIIALGYSSASSVAASSKSNQVSDTLVYKAAFKPYDWSGALEVYKPDFNTKNPDTDPSWTTPLWSAEDKIPSWNYRSIYTWNPQPDDNTSPKGVEFSWIALNAAQRSFLDNSMDLLDWLKGDQSNEPMDPDDTSDPSKFRYREVLLGDLVHSDPIYVGAPEDLGYANLPDSATEKAFYVNFLKVQKDRPKTLYVGANDGMLHAFDADYGDERFAYIPNAVFPNLKKLSLHSYTKNSSEHRFFVDSSPTVSEAYIKSEWRTVLIGALGAGGRSVFGLDVTSPDLFDTSDILWEFSDSDLGYLVGQMTSSMIIGRLQNGKWAVIFGNGYDSGTGAWLYILNLENGEILRKMQLSGSSTNGLSAVEVVLDKHQQIVGAYGGDLEGHLWKFDLSSTDPDNWHIAFSGSPLFNAKDPDSNSQPITAPLNVTAVSRGGFMIYFGTGQYMRSIDPSIKDVQTAYAVWDTQALDESGAKPVWTGGSAILDFRATPDILLKQEIVKEVEIEGSIFRVFSNELLNFGTLAAPLKHGWYVDLISPNENAEGGPKELGERIVSRAALLPKSNLVLFTSIVPRESDDPCAVSGGESWFFALDMDTGGRVNDYIFDVNGDGNFDSRDTTTITVDGKEIVVPLSGKKVNFISDAPRVIEGDSKYSLVFGTEDGLSKIDVYKPNSSKLEGWRQLR